MKYVMEEGLRVETAVQEACNGITQDLHKAKPPEVSFVTLWDQNHCILCDFVGKSYIIVASSLVVAN